MADKLYCGSAKARDTQYGEQLTVSIDLTECTKQFADYGYISKTDKHFITLKVSRRKEVGKYGETHTVEIDTWKPETRTQAGSGYGNGNSHQSSQQNAPAASVARPVGNQQQDFPDDIPF